ncbi:phosphate ABC transporter substrate-binding protein [Pararhodobacter marinus]|uniref:Phosphate ABC transporter substrate-binding protein n=1 Tax=Pararhodobacter marinus TaxID=2184063 RepID=A0A2U2CG12_9RHOB|nr:PhnD/SsuA/transferrin family substrate-binding protein [Pararhodobacter marinus]PWE30826.1 phosphate ABC transporter substrate-binding protein [Pararhodobacter marinus]
MTQTTPLASLPMYDWPEVHAETDAQWQALRAAMACVDLPETLTRPDTGPYKLNDHWRDPALVFSQCCWGPLDAGMIGFLIPLAQPDYGAWPGGRGPFYRSAMVVRKGEGAPAPLPSGSAAELPDGALKGRRFAYNDTESLSGYRGLAADLGADPATLAAQAILSGGHRNSVRMVAQHEADIAVIDCRSWALAQRFEPEAASRLEVIGWTGEQPGIAYVTSRATEASAVTAMREGLLAAGCHPVAPR